MIEPVLPATPPLELLLSHGYSLAGDAHEQAIMKPYPPLGLLSLAAYLRRQGRSVVVYDTTFGSLEGFAATLAERRPATVGLSTNLMTRATVLRMIAAAKAAGTRVVLGGPEAAPNAHEYLCRGADVVVVGEGELTLDELLGLEQWSPEQLAGVLGVAYLAPGEVLTTTPARPLIQPLESLPWPDRESIDLDRYLAVWKQHHGHSSVSLITSRGCPYTCTWCSHAVFGVSHRRRAVADVADEVASILERWAPDRLWYADDVLTLNMRWFHAYADELARRGLKVPFECISRADRIDEAIADRLAEMGCVRLWIGAESGSQQVLDRMKRRTAIADVRAKTALLQARGIEVGMFIMLGFEGEEVEDLAATIDHLVATAPDVFLTTVAYPIKGTAYHDEVADRVESPLPWDRRTDRDLRIVGRRSARYYRQATRWMVNEVALQRALASGNRNLFALGRSWLAARVGQAGMWLLRGEREETRNQAAGRGWSTEEQQAIGRLK